MTLLQLGAVFGGLLILLVAIAVVIVRQSRPRSSETPSKAARPEKPSKAALTADLREPPRRTRRLVTDLPDRDVVPFLGGHRHRQCSSYAEVEGRLETAFDELQRGEISLGTYRLIVLNERARVREDLAYLSTADGEDRLSSIDESRQALVVIRYCLDWVRDQG